MATPKIGILHSGSPDQHGQQIAAFLSGLAEAGYVDGDNVTVTYLWADDNRQTLKTNATNLVAVPVDVIVAAGGSASAKAAQAATIAASPTNPIPVVFTTVADPVASGLVASLDEPGGNITGTAGLTSELDPKRLELLKEFSPTITQIGVLTNSSRPKFPAQIQELRAAAPSGLTLVEKDATTPAEIDTAFANFPTTIQAVLVTADPLFNNQRKKVIKAVKAKGLPAIYQWREFVSAGGLMSYGPSITDAYQQAGIYAARILDGNKPQSLPVMLPSSYELVINLKTANKMSLKIPVSMLTRAVLLRRKR